MYINHDVFAMVNLTAVGLLSSAVQQLGMRFSYSQLNKLFYIRRLDGQMEIFDAIEDLVENEILVCKGKIYEVDRFYISLTEDELLNF